MGNTGNYRLTFSFPDNLCESVQSVDNSAFFLFVFP